jgi:hypothetical protein
MPAAIYEAGQGLAEDGIPVGSALVPDGMIIGPKKVEKMKNSPA